MNTIDEKENIKYFTCRTRWQFMFGNVSDSLEVIVAGIAEMCGAEAEENCYRTAIATLIL